jgi:hypothetical protein
MNINKNVLALALAASSIVAISAETVTCAIPTNGTIEVAYDDTYCYVRCMVGEDVVADSKAEGLLTSMYCAGDGCSIDAKFVNEQTNTAIDLAITVIETAVVLDVVHNNQVDSENDTIEHNTVELTEAIQPATGEIIQQDERGFTVAFLKK